MKVTKIEKLNDRYIQYDLTTSTDNFYIETKTSGILVHNSPAVFAGIDPTDGKFFVAKKGIFNKNPKVYKTLADIDADTSGDLNAKLKVAFLELSDIGIKGVIQGDIMFTNDKDIETIDGVKYITFQPNTIVYAVPVDSDLGKEISKAKLGVVWHTTYKGSSFENMSASYGVDVSKLKKKSSVWMHDAMVRDLSGKATLTKVDTDEVTAAISKAGKIFRQIASSTLKQIEQDPTLAQEIETYNNSHIRVGQYITNPAIHVQGLIKWYQDKYAKEIEKRKSEKGKAAQQAKLDERLAFFSPANKSNLVLIFALQKAIYDAKLIIINKLDSIKSIDTFIRTRNGFKVTGSEGFVAIDHLSNGAVKLVNQLEFSYANFSPDVIKGWDR